MKKKIILQSNEGGKIKIQINNDDIKKVIKNITFIQT